MKNWIIEKCFWLLKRWNVPVIILPPKVVDILPIVAVEVERTAAMTGLLSNEYRHAHTYGTCKKRLPTASGRHIGLAIEVVINGSK